MDMDNERLQALGRITVLAAQLEYYLYAIVCELTSEDIETAKAAVGTRQYSELEKMAPALLAAAGLPAMSDQLKERLISGQKAMRGRNTILHSHWISETVQAHRKNGRRVEVTLEDIENATTWLENAVSGMEDMWVLILNALGRLKLDDKNQVEFPDRTGTPERVEKWAFERVNPHRYGHLFLNSSGTLSAAGEVVTGAEVLDLDS